MRLFVLAGCLGLILSSCGPREPLVVKQFTVSEVDPSWRQDLLVRGEIQKEALWSGRTGGPRKEKRAVLFGPLACRAEQWSGDGSLSVSAG